VNLPREAWDNGAGGKFSLSIDVAGMVNAYFENQYRSERVEIPVENFLSFAAKLGARAFDVEEDPAGGPPLRVEDRGQRDGSRLWAVTWLGHHCLNKDGEWEREPLPSSRDDDFLERTRWATVGEAWGAAYEAIPAWLEARRGTM